MNYAIPEYEEIVSQIPIRRAINSASTNEEESEVPPGAEGPVKRDKRAGAGLTLLLTVTEVFKSSSMKKGVRIYSTLRC